MIQSATLILLASVLLTQPEKSDKPLIDKPSLLDQVESLESKLEGLEARKTDPKEPAASDQGTDQRTGGRSPGGGRRAPSIERGLERPRI